MRIEPEITGVLIELTPMERRLLATLLAQYDEMVHDQLDDGDLGGDPALARLFPNASPDDEEAAAEFRRYTRDGLIERKTANSGLISAALMASSDGERITVARDDAEHWLPALTDLRLVLAERLGIHRESDRIPANELGDVYEWLGELQWALVEALD